MFDRFARLVGWLGIVGALGAAAASAQDRPDPPFVVPKDRAEWEARRPEVLLQVGGRVDKDPPETLRYVAQLGGPEPLASHPDVLVDPVRAVPVDPSRYRAVDGQFLRPARVDPARKIPLVVLLVDRRPAGDPATRPGWDGRPPALVLVEMGFAVLLFDNPTLGDPFGSMSIYPLRASLGATLEQRGVDPGRIAVLGLGGNGFIALNLMARDPRVACGVVAIESKAAAMALYAATKGFSGTETTHHQELAALCAPRPLQLMIGEPLPLPAPGKSVGRTLERAAKGAYKVYGKEGEFNFTLYGEFADQTSISTRLQWLNGLEWLDKHLRPQGPTPLGHAAEPEPTLDPGDREVLTLTEHGIAGWSPEMSGRDSTWTWRDGVVACRPKAHEYGWLRAPVEVADYLLTVEWKVPAKGNAGIFMRAKPVDWILPPSEDSKLRISTLGLTWPSRTGLELQTQDDRDANRYSTGSLYRHAAPAANPTHSPDQWNRSTVRARGTRIEVWNNGEQVLDADLARCTDTLPVPPLRGYIGLQNHGAPAEYRNVRLRRLMPELGQAQAQGTGSPGVIPSGSASR